MGNASSENDVQPDSKTLSPSVSIDSNGSENVGRNLMFQSALVGAMALIRGVYLEGYEMGSPHLWLDIGLHMACKFVSAGVTEEFILPIGTTMVGDFARVADPLMHGMLAGTIKETYIDSGTVSQLGFIGAGGPSSSYYSFETGFLEGFAYSGAAAGISIMVGMN